MIRTGEMALLKQIHTSPHCLAYNDMKARQKILWSITYFNDYFERSRKIDAPQNLKITDEEIANAVRGASV